MSSTGSHRTFWTLLDPLDSTGPPEPPWTRVPLETLRTRQPDFCGSSGMSLTSRVTKEVKSTKAENECRSDWAFEHSGLKKRYLVFTFLRKGQLNRHTRYRPATTTFIFLETGSVESTHKVPTSHYRTKHCHAAVAPLGGLTHR